MFCCGRHSIFSTFIHSVNSLIFPFPHPYTTRRHASLLALMPTLTLETLQLYINTHIHISIYSAMTAHSHFLTQVPLSITARAISPGPGRADVRLVLARLCRSTSPTDVVLFRAVILTPRLREAPSGLPRPELASSLDWRTRWSLRCRLASCSVRVQSAVGDAGMWRHQLLIVLQLRESSDLLVAVGSPSGPKVG